MIRPYLTVLRDSFHEAFASRVLWILLAVSTLLLISLIPLGLSEQRATELRLGSIRDWPALIGHIRRDAEASTPSPGKRISQLASDEFRRIVRDTGRKDKPADFSREMVSRLLEDLNKLLANPKLYDKATWAGVELDRKTSDLLAKGVENLSTPEVILLNRQLLKAAFPGEISKVPDEELVFSYFGRRFGSPLPISRKLADPVINQILAQAMNFFVGSIAVFVAILVTASIIPQTFEAGAIDLLLSKPVARPLLFLVKFFGGCAFILLNGGYFVVGLWAIMGLRFGLWNNSLLVCIPIFLFLFVVYYSVSAFAAVLWKNAIVSVVITILFWAACFTVGSAKTVVEQLFVNPSRIVNLVPTGDSLVAINQSGEFQEWRSGAWETVLKPEQRGGPPFAGGVALIGPVYVPGRKQLLYLPRSMGPRRFQMFGPSAAMVTATWSGGSWKQSAGPTAPAGTSWLFLGPNDETTLVASSGVYRLNEKSAAGGTPPSILGFTLPTGGESPFVPLGPKPALDLENTFTAAMDPVSGDIVVCQAGALRYLRRDKQGKYTRGQERKLDGDEEATSLAMAGSTIVLAQRDGRVLMLGAPDLKSRKESRPAGRSEPYLVKATPDGHWFAVLFDSGRLVLLDATGNPRMTLGNTVSAATFDGNASLVVADRGTRVTRYNLDTLRISDRREPALDMLAASYRYFILPFYTIFPKPGELGNVVSYLLTDPKAVMPGGPTAAEMRQVRPKMDIYGPIWSSLAFVVVLLGVTCVYVSRADF